MPSWSDRWRDVLRAVGLARNPQALPPPAGADSPQSPGYDVGQSLSAWAAFPWVRACVDAISTDLAGLPIVAVRGQGATAVPLDGHPALDLLAAPTSDIGGVLWRRQVVLFTLLSGNAYALMLGGRRPVSLPLMHPEQVRPIRGTVGVQGYEYRPTGGEVVNYDPADVLHFRLPGWRVDSFGEQGDGLIQALHRDLDGDFKAANLAAQQAQYGRPAAVISPKGDLPLNADTRNNIARAYAEMMRKGNPVLVADTRIEVDFPSTTLRDMEFTTQRQLTRETVLAAFGVPPTRVGLPEANYATASNADKVYWTNLQGLAALLDGTLTRLVRRFGDSGVTLRHDFSGVSALQESRTERVARVRAWYDLGATPAEAAAYEGFTDAPVPTERPAAPVTTTPGQQDDEDDDDAPDQARGLPWMGGVIRAQRRLMVPSTEDERAAVWRGWLDSTWTPAEKRLAREVLRALGDQRDRIAGRLGEAPIARGLPDARNRDILAGLVDFLFAGELGAMADALRDAVLDVLRYGYAAATGQLDVTGDADHPEEVRDRIASEIAARIEPTSRAVVETIIREELERGGSVQDMQSRLQLSGAFGRVRALRIARTESTRATNAGSVLAYQDALTMDGLAVRKMWLSARDPEVRDPHVVLDSQQRMVGEAFEVPAGVEFSGSKGMFPGDFAEAGMVVNCRCTLVPVVEDA